MKIISTNPNAKPVAAETAITRSVSLTASSLVGQVTFFSSPTTSPKNWNRPLLGPVVAEEDGFLNIFPPERANLSYFPMKSCASTSRAEFIQLNSIRVVTAVLLRIISTLPAIGASQSYKHSRFSFSLSHLYSTMLVTTPDPTVLPPSRMAKRNPFSSTIGLINFIVISMLSPGTTISTPPGNSISPVTSVVLI